MAVTSGTDALVILFAALSEDEQEDAYQRIAELRLRRLAGTENAMARFIGSMQRVAEHVGHVPAIDEYKQASEELRAAGEDVETFARLYKHFGSWPRAREAVELAETTTARRIDARFRYRMLGKVWRFTEDTLRETLERCVEHYGRPPTVAEFDWWRERELELARAAGDDTLQLPSAGPYRRRYKTWEGALLHFGYTPEEVALRHDARAEYTRRDPDAGLPDDLPVAELRTTASELPLTGAQVERLRAAWAALPRRSRYVLTVRLGLGVQRRTLAPAASPLGLHLDRIRQLQALALNSLAEAAAGEGRGRPDPATLHDAVVACLRQLAAPSG